MMTPQQMQNMNPQQLAQMQMMMQAQMQMMMQMQMQMQQPGAAGYPGQSAAPAGSPNSGNPAPPAQAFPDLCSEFQQKASINDGSNPGAHAAPAPNSGASPFDMFG